MIISNIKPFIGDHCETIATGTLLNHIDINLSEPMIFGLGEGLSFFFWKMKSMDSPFFFGRTKPLQLSERLAINMNLNIEVSVTSSVKKGWSNILLRLESNSPIALMLDMYYLEYFEMDEHFPGHFVVMYGYDDEYAYLIDWNGIGSKVKTSLKSLELARTAKVPRSSKNLSYFFTKNAKNYNLETAVITATANNAKEYLNAPIKNIGYEGIIKAGNEMKKCFQSGKCTWDLKGIAEFMEEAGTGGAIFRNLYRDFLKEASEINSAKQLRDGYIRFVDIAALWKVFSMKITEIGTLKTFEDIDSACAILYEIAEKEKQAMEMLATL